MAVSGTLQLTKTAVSGESDRREIAYYLRTTGATDTTIDDIEVLDYAEQNSPTIYDGCDRKGFDIEHISDIDPEIWLVTARYERASGRTREETKVSPVGTIDYNFDVSLGNERIRNAISNTTYSNSAAPEPDKFAGSGGPMLVSYVNGQDEVEGIDIRVPISSFSLVYTAAAATLSQTYINSVQDLVGKVNSTTFRGRAAGEVMLTGVRGRQRSTGNSEITFTFEVRENRVFDLGQGQTAIIGIVKDGFDVGWPYYRKLLNLQTQKLDIVLTNYVVSRIYERADLNAIFQAEETLGTIGGLTLGTISGEPLGLL